MTPSPSFIIKKDGRRVSLLDGPEKVELCQILRNIESRLKVLEAKGIKLENSDVAGVIAFAQSRKAQRGDVAAARFISEQTEAALPRLVQVEARIEVTKIERLILQDPRKKE